MNNNNTGFINAGFARRALAQLIDAVIFLLFWAVPVYFISGSMVSSVDPFKPIINLITVILLLFFVGTIIHFIYSVYFYEKFGGTIGKLLCGLKILDQNTNNHLDKKTAMYRILAGYSFSAGFLGLGYFMALKSDENLAWHDELFNTKVVKTSSFIPGIISFIILTGVLAMVISGAIQNFSKSTLLQSAFETEVSTQN